MIPLGLLIVLGIVFFLLTMLVNSKHELSLWKLSILPALFHGLPEEMINHEYTTVSTMGRVAQDASVRLQVSDPEKKCCCCRNDAMFFGIIIIFFFFNFEF